MKNNQQLKIKITGLDLHKEFDNVDALIKTIFPEMDRKIFIGRKLKKSNDDISRSIMSQFRLSLIEYITQEFMEELRDEIRKETNFKDVDKGVHEWMSQKELSMIRIANTNQKFDIESFVMNKIEGKDD